MKHFLILVPWEKPAPLSKGLALFNRQEKKSKRRKRELREGAGGEWIAAQTDQVSSGELGLKKNCTLPGQQGRAITWS